MPGTTEAGHGRRVGMVVFSYYPDDPRVRREAEALHADGMTVDVLCLKRPDESRHEIVSGVGVYRLPVVRKRGSPVRYMWEYLLFFVLAFWKLTVRHATRPYDVVHVHNMPDFLTFAALVPRISGARIVLDLHDPMPEVFMTKYGLPEKHLLIRILRVLERWSVGFAHLVLTPNIAFQRLFVSRGCPEGKIHVVMNSPDDRIFGDANGQRIAPSVPDAPFILMYHGTIVERHGLGTALDALGRLRNEIPRLEFHVYGEGDYVGGFKEKTEELGLTDIVRYHGQVSLEVIAERIGGINIGIIPNKRSVFTEINLPTRIFEYLARGKPVVVPRTTGIQDYFDENAIHFFEPGNPGALAEAIFGIYRNPEQSRRVLDNGLTVYRSHAWSVQKERLIFLLRSV